MFSYTKVFIFFLAIIIIAWVAGAILNSEEQKDSNIKDTLISKIINDKPVEPVEIKGECVVAGCSNQLCLDEEDANGIVSTCEYRDIYACYVNANCERQKGGECGWAETQELIECVGKFGRQSEE